MYCSLGEGDGFLRLDDFDVVADAGGKPVARLGELLRREVARACGDLELFAGGLEIQERGPHVVVDAGLQIFGFSAPVPEVGVGLDQPSCVRPP